MQEPYGETVEVDEELSLLLAYAFGQIGKMEYQKKLDIALKRKKELPLQNPSLFVPKVKENEIL